MDFDNIRWPEKIRDPRKIEAKKLARYVCESCGMGWDDGHRDLAVRRGCWVPYHYDDKWPNGEISPMAPSEVPQRPENVALHLSAWYSPFVSLSECAGMFLRGQESPDKLRIFVTQYKAECWKQTVVTATEDKILSAKVKNLPPQHVPETAIALTCGIDHQKYGFPFTVRAWARDYTNWLIHYGLLSTWAEVEHLLFMAQYPVIGGGPSGSASLRIWRAGIDTGGTKYKEEMGMAEEVYFWITQNRGRGCPVWGTKGASRPLAAKLSVGKSLERAPSGKAIPGGIQLISLDTDKFKDLYHFRVEKATAGEGGPMASFLHQDTGRDYSRQILAEVKERQKNGREMWVQKARDNHYLDCEVIAHALADPEWPGGGVHLLADPHEEDAGPAAAEEGPGEGARDGGRRRPDWFNNRRGR
jgi:phage terminase large subunit GpA-like protein